MYKYFKLVEDTNKKVKILPGYNYFYIRKFDKFLSTMTTTSFIKEQLVNVKDCKDSKFYKAKVVEVDEKLGELKVPYVGWNNRYDEVVPLALRSGMRSLLLLCSHRPGRHLSVQL